MGGWTLENPVFANYVFYAGILALKVIIMGPITGYYRITKKVFMNEEDAKSMGAKEVKTNDPDVERVRRAHQNDLENIPVFWILGLLYILTDPSVALSKIIFRVYTMSRIIYTVLYLSGSNKRGMPFMIGMVINVFLAVSVIITFIN
ncbi:microsomal glutathione S-transferase 1-like [Macrobrachium rosenbergii]|uniref:microsomal glutathione S-transferase 1-like n=1 Tax=Macrobrachium rosenbergii TaxID=79674 RepID=UPI0034D5E45C